MKLRLILIISTVLFLYQTTSATHKIYIIHGYAGSAFQMNNIYKGLIHEGYTSENYTYPSFKENLDSVGMDLYRKIKEENYDTVSFVTHSMGALVVRSMYQYMDSTNCFPVIYRFVMLAPPNKGCQYADFFSKSPLKALLGPNVSLMRTDSDSYVAKLPLPTCQVGLIIGTAGSKHGFNPFMGDDNDGTVTVKSAVLGIEQDIVTIRSMHILMPRKKKAVKLVLRFMKTGAFSNLAT